MPAKVEVIQIGEALGIELPESIVGPLFLEAGDVLSVHEVPDGVELRLTDDSGLRAMREVMRRNRDVLKRLADS